MAWSVGELVDITGPVRGWYVARFHIRSETCLECLAMKFRHEPSLQEVKEEASRVVLGRNRGLSLQAEEEEARLILEKVRGALRSGAKREDLEAALQEVAFKPAKPDAIEPPLNEDVIPAEEAAVKK
jgi:hypothetical protein